MKKQKITELLIFIIATELVGALSGLMAGNSFSFYKELIKPPLSPPGWLFPVMWAILYALMGISAFMIYTSDAKEKCKALVIYGTQLFVNFMWSIPQNSSGSRLSEYSLFAVDSICFVS